MRKIVLIATAIATVIGAMSAAADPPKESPQPPPSNVTVKVTDAKCTRKTCSALVTTAGPPSEINVACTFAVDLFSRARLTKDAVSFALGLGPGQEVEDLAERHAVLCGESKKITMKVTSLGKFVINKALENGRRKLKGKSEAALGFFERNPNQNLGEPVNYYYWALQTGPIRIKLKG